MPCDFGEGLSKHKDMVKPERGDSGDQRLRYDVCAVIFATDSDFQDRHIDLVMPVRLNGLRAEDDAHFEGKEGMIGHQSQITEICGTQLGIRVFPLMKVPS